MAVCLGRIIMSKKSLLWQSYGETHQNKFYHSISYLFERLKQVATRDRQSDVYMVHDEKWLLLGLVRKARQVVCYEEQHVYLCFLQDAKETYNHINSSETTFIL